MSEQKTSPNDGHPRLTQHAMLVVWGAYAQQIGLVKALEQVELSQKCRTHRPQTKIIEFLVAILAGLPHLQDLSRSAHPLVRDQAVAEAWDQPAWADYSGVSRTLQSLSDEEVTALVAAIDAISQPIIDLECERAVASAGRLVYDADLTGRPVSSTSISYPDTAFGYIGDTVRLGYQAALVTLHSPTYGRLWLSNQLHPGDTVSTTQAQSLVLAAEARTGLRPRRRTELVASRLAVAQAALAVAETTYDVACDRHKEASDQVHDTKLELAEWSRKQQQLEHQYQQAGRQPTAYCKLAQARRKTATYEQRLPRTEKALGVAQKRMARCERKYVAAGEEVNRLREHHRRLLAENERNPHPVRSLFRLDGGFASQENIAWLTEMGYDVDTKARSTAVRDGLIAALTPATIWQRVGGNAALTAWPKTTADGHFTYPVDLALARYQLGKTTRHSVLVHYSDDECHRRPGWLVPSLQRQADH
ncbi:hypothetical protein GC175_33860 [bacterium]|nr:hypothetical protein [bacterium]